jgi:hypothetical protein
MEGVRGSRVIESRVRRESGKAGFQAAAVTIFVCSSTATPPEAKPRGGRDLTQPCLCPHRSDEIGIYN